MTVGEKAQNIVYSVSEFLELLNNFLVKHRAKVQGEITKVNVGPTGHVYFDIKDKKESAIINCALWKSRANSYKELLESGTEVILTGNPNIYAPSGKFSFITEKIEYAGEGGLRKAFELLKKKLEKEGLFAEDRKRAIPVFPETIGLITSEGSDAYNDVITTINERWSGVTIKLCHSSVQGKNAINEIQEGFQYFNKNKNVEVIILARGGGSLEDFQAFNSEEVARAVFSSEIPVICGVGHTPDESLADYVADKRAITPTDAGKIVVPDKEDILFRISNSKKIVESIIIEKLRSRNQKITEYIARTTGRVEERIENVRTVVRGSTKTIASLMSSRIQNAKISVVGNTERIANKIKYRAANGITLISARTAAMIKSYDFIRNKKRDAINASIRLIKSYDPNQVLQRGYSLTSVDGRVIKSIEKISIGSTLVTQLADGSLKSNLINKEKNNARRKKIIR